MEDLRVRGVLTEMEYKVISTYGHLLQISLLCLCSYNIVLKDIGGLGIDELLCIHDQLQFMEMGYV